MGGCQITTVKLKHLTMKICHSTTVGPVPSLLYVLHKTVCTGRAQRSKPNRPENTTTCVDVWTIRLCETLIKFSDPRSGWSRTTYSTQSSTDSCRLGVVVFHHSLTQMQAPHPILGFVLSFTESGVGDNRRLICCIITTKVASDHF